MSDLPRPYPGYDVLDKWDTPSWNDATRNVVADRLERVPGRRFFSVAEWETLVALCETVLPQPDRADPIPLAPFVDAALTEDRTTGTRWSPLPTMREAWQCGLAAIDAEARAVHERRFHELEPERRRELLKAIDDEDVRAPDWRDLPPRRLFRHVLANEIVRIYYSHPDAWNEIGFGGPASPRGYVRLSANRRDAWEAELERPKRRSERRK